jgi:pyruvate dehydrogenase E2 component (dihydrolipoamide acetyltransferase)
MAMVEVKVPDIGDFKDVPVIEVFVKPGDTVKPEDPLVTLESEKATMDVPSPAAGVVESLRVKVGDRVSEGSVLALLASEQGASAGGPATKAQAPAAAAPASSAAQRPAAPASAPAGAAAAAPGKSAPAPAAARYTEAPTSSARCSCWDPVPEVIRRRSARPTSE